MKWLFAILSLWVLCALVTPSQAMAFEVDALAAEQIEDPSFIEAASEANAEAELEAAMDAELEAEAELDAELSNSAEMDVDVDAEAEAETEVETEEEAEEQADVDEEAEADSEEETEEEAETEADETPKSFLDVAAQDVPIVPQPPVNVTVQYPTGPNPADADCGCYNNARCLNKVCMCTPQWVGQWCERPSALALSREAEVSRLGNLTDVIANVSRQMIQIEANAGNPQAIQNLIAEAARKEVSNLHISYAERQFHQALGNNDMFNAKTQLNLIKHLDFDRYVPLSRELAVQEDRIAQQFNQTNPMPQQMPVPVMHDEKYNDIPVGTARDLRQATFMKAEDLMQKSREISRQFNLDYGDPV